MNQNKEKFTNCNLSKKETEGRLIAVNDKFLAMSWDEQGEIVIVNSSEPHDINEKQPHLNGYSKNIYDLEFSPFNSNILASCYDDNSVLLWKIPDNGLNHNKNNNPEIYKEHNTEVRFVNFNKVSSNLICSCDLNGELHVWDINEKKKINELKIDNEPTMVLWNPNGNLIGVTSKNQFINIFDIRDNNNIILQKKINELSFTSKFDWIDDNSFVTTGWDKDEDKLLKIWDLKNNQNETSSTIIDTFSKATTPFVNPQSKIIYTIGKEELTIRVFDYKEGNLQKYKTFYTSKFSKYLVSFNRKYLDYNKSEIDRFAKFCNNEIYYISFFNKNDNDLSISDKINHNNLMDQEESTDFSSKTTRNEDILNKIIEKLDKITKNINNVEIFEKDLKEVQLSTIQLKNILKSEKETKIEEEEKETKQISNQIEQSKNEYKEINKNYLEEKEKNEKLNKKIEELNLNIKDNNEKAELNKKNEEELKEKIKEIEEENKKLNEENQEINKMKEEINDLLKIQDLYNQQKAELEHLEGENNCYLQENEEYKKGFEIYKEEIKEELSKKYVKLLKEELNKINNCLNAKMQNLFEIIKNKNEKKYREGEEIFLQKIKELNKNILNLPKCKTIHYGKKCQRCFKDPIIGIRYHCSKCNNYNLCEKCEEENSISNDHPHLFIKIRREELNDDNNYTFIQNNNNITNNINIHNSNLIIRDIPNDILQKSKYSYKCINKDNLTTLIYKGIPEVKISLILKNDGDRTWVKNETKLIFDRDSDYSIGDIILDPQKPNEQKKYDIIFKGLENYSSNQCNIILNFYCDNDYYGEQIYFSIKFKEKNC